MKGFLVLFLFVFISFPLPFVLFLQEEQPQARPEIRVDAGVTEPNQVSLIRVTVTNPNTADLLWGNVLKIGEAHPYFVPLQSEYTLSHEIRPGSTDIGELTFQTTRDAEAGSYPLTISLSGGVGPCEEGCMPYFVEKEVQIKVIRNSPDIEVSHTVEDTSITVTLYNRGSGKAKSVVCDSVMIPVLSPGDTREITIDRTSTFTVEYEDEYGKTFSQSYRISVDKPEPKDSSLQTGLVLAGIVLGYLFKKSRN